MVRNTENIPPVKDLKQMEGPEVGISNSILNSLWFRSFLVVILIISIFSIISVLFGRLRNINNDNLNTSDELTEIEDVKPLNTVTTIASVNINDQQHPIEIPDYLPIFSKKELTKLREHYKLRFSKQLDEKFPVYEYNSQVALRSRDGQIFRGSFEGVKHGQVSIKQLNDEYLLVMVDDLDSKFRIRCDINYREEAIEKRVQKYMQEQAFNTD